MLILELFGVGGAVPLNSLSSIPSADDASQTSKNVLYEQFISVKTRFFKMNFTR